MVELQTGVRACNDPGPGQRCQLATATDEIVVDVRLEDMRDAEALSARHLLILIDVAKRVDESGHSASFRNQQVGAVAKTFIDEFAHLHASRSPRRPVVWSH